MEGEEDLWTGVKDTWKPGQGAVAHECLGIQCKDNLFLILGAFHLYYRKRKV